MKGQIERYSNPFRPIYERGAAIAWATAATIGAGMAVGGYAGRWVPLSMSVLASIQMVLWGHRWRKLRGVHRRLTVDVQTVMQLEELRPFIAPNRDATWIGWGFEWGQREAQLALEVIRSDPSKVAPPRNGRECTEPGQPWLQGIGRNEVPLFLPVTDEHSLFVAMSGWGKTFFFRLLIAQAAERGEAVIVLDPKGDEGMRNAVRTAAAWAGKELQELNAAFPARSIRMDPLKNWDDPTELATRISTLCGTPGQRDNFTSFVFMQLVNVIQGMLLVGTRPSLVALKRVFDSGLAKLLADAITAYCNRELEPTWHKSVDRYRRVVVGKRKGKGGAETTDNLSLSPEEEAAALSEFYREYVRALAPNPELEGLISTVEHPHEHFLKMIMTLMPVLTKLTSGALASLLSTDTTAKDDKRLITDTARVIEKQDVVYIGLNALGNEEVANAVGEILLADLAAVCGSRYNYADKRKVVSIFVDEAVEVLNAKLILLMNKGRGAQFRLTLATQTISDFESRLGSAAMAEKVLGNMSNVFAGRLTADISQKYFQTKAPQVSLTTMGRGNAVQSMSEDPLEFRITQSEQITVEEDYAIKESYLACLPKFNYFAMLGGSRFVKGRIPILV